MRVPSSVWQKRISCSGGGGGSPCAAPGPGSSSTFTSSAMNWYPRPKDVRITRCAAPSSPTARAGRLDPAGQRRFADEPVAPDLVQQLVLRDHPRPVGQQVGEHVEHLALDVHRDAAAAQLEPIDVDLEVREQVAHRAEGNVPRCRRGSPRVLPAPSTRRSSATSTVCDAWTWEGRSWT